MSEGYVTEDGDVWCCEACYRLATGIELEDGCKPGCRHRCPVCRMGLVSHLPCDPQCDLHTDREDGSRDV